VDLGDALPQAATWDGHLLLVFWTEQDRAPRLAAWMKRGLDRGDAILYAGADVAPLESVLRPFGLDLARTVRSGQLRRVPDESLIVGDGPVTSVEHTLGHGYPGVRLLAGATALRNHLSDAGRLAAFERTVNDLCSSRPVGWLCELDRSTAPDDWTRLLSGTHSGGIRESNVRTRMVGTDTFELAGDIDVANSDVVGAALAAVRVADGQRARLTVDLREVSFIDVIGCRSIVEGTERLRAEGGHVTIRSRQRIHHVLELYGLGSMANFDLTG
jgi:anti-anti-sigma factor